MRLGPRGESVYLVEEVTDHQNKQCRHVGSNDSDVERLLTPETCGRNETSEDGDSSRVDTPTRWEVPARVHLQRKTTHTQSEWRILISVLPVSNQSHSGAT